jgi:hypothetical protein
MRMVMMMRKVGCKMGLMLMLKEIKSMMPQEKEREVKWQEKEINKLMGVIK